MCPSPPPDKERLLPPRRETDGVSAGGDFYEVLMKTHITIEQLEQMKTHELADLLSNLALLLRRMPDVPCGQLTQQIPDDKVYRQQELPQQVLLTSASTYEALNKKKLVELKKLADDQLISYTGNIKKADLIKKILAQPADGHSEQYAMRDL